MKIRGLLLVALLYAVLPAVQAWVYLSGLPFADTNDVLNFAASIVAYHWLLANVLIGLKLPLLQNSLPYDLRIRLHVWSTLGLTAFLAWHSVYTIFLKAKEIDVVSWSLMALFLGILFLSVLWIPLPGLKALRSRLVGAFQWGFLKSYDWLKASHKVLFFALAGLSYVHVIQAEIVAEVPVWSAWAYQGLFLVTVAAFLWTRIHNLTLPRLEVQSVVTSGGIVRVALAGHPRLRYRAGQFAFLRFENDDLRGEEHPFSFTTARHEPNVGFAVRALGDFTSKVATLQPGDRVKVNGGFGAFHPASGRRPLALIGSGIGAAPLVSILKDIGHREPNREVVCLLSVTRRDELVDQAALDELTAVMPHLTLKVFVTEENPTLYGPELFAREFAHPQKYQYYLCSSDRVRTIVIDALRSLGVPKRAIHFEAFHLG